MPLCDYFAQFGYNVNAEVKNVDMTVTYDDILIAVEMKESFSLKLIEQGIDRQTFADGVYLAIPRPKQFSQTSWKHKITLLKKLGLGMLFVKIGKSKSVVECLLTPELKRRGNYRRKRAVLAELNSRKCEPNIGGVTRTKIMTSYKQQALFIAHLLYEYGELTPKKLRELGSDAKKTTPILYNNYYNWYCRLGKGVYCISDIGKLALVENKHIVDTF